MSRLLHRIGGAAAAHPWRTLAAWVVALVATFGLAAGLGAPTHDDYTVRGTASQASTDLLRSQFPGAAGATARVVLHGTGRLDAGVVSEVRGRLADLPSVVSVSDPLPSRDRDTALLTVTYDAPVTDLPPQESVDALRAAAAPAQRAGLTVELGGELPENFTAPNGTAEAVGFVAALVILLVALGSVVAAGLPLAVALVGVGIGGAGITLMAAVTDVSTSAPTVASMVGIGVGIDYALLLLTRHVEGLRRGLTPVQAAARATGTAGLSVVFAGGIVLVSLLGLRLAGLPVYASFGFATGLVVLLVVAAALTLVPALARLAGRRLLPRRERRAGVADPAGRRTPSLTSSSPHRSERPTATARWAQRVGRRPLPWALGAFVLLLALAAPVLGMRTWPQDAGSQPESTTVRRAYDLVAAEYGPGANGPLLVTADLHRVDSARLADVGRELAATPGVVGVTGPQVSPSGGAATWAVQPAWSPQDERSTRLVEHLRDDVLPQGVGITGSTAVFVDIADLLSRRIWLVIGFVVAVSLLALLLVFRSPVVAVKASLANLLSVGAAYGVLTAVFQWGWGAEALGLPHAVPVSTWVPVLLFAVLFGLSMDYEVFLLSRVREEWQATGDARGSVVRGLAATGRVITSAALIMVAVFVGFGLDPDVTVKMIGVGMATAILVDATVVRMVLVPATMLLLGRANWWLPSWLDRVLPDVDLHGSDDPAEVSGSGVPAPQRPTQEPAPAT